MKKTLLTLVLLMLAWMLAAQTGLFSLSYGESYADAKKALNEDTYAYQEISNKDGVSTFISETNDYVEKMLLFFDKGVLVSWQIFFLEQEDEDIEELVAGSAEEWHGSEEYWDEDYECWVWNLDGKKSLYLGYNFDAYLVADYYNADYPQFSELVYW
jgi:hypothetical protein